ncbi:hypothetical protein RUND412_002342 [Rhizina undulata]
MATEKTAPAAQKTEQKSAKGESSGTLDVCSCSAHRRLPNDKPSMVAPKAISSSATTPLKIYSAPTSTARGTAAHSAPESEDNYAEANNINKASPFAEKSRRLTLLFLLAIITGVTTVIIHNTTKDIASALAIAAILSQFFTKMVDLVPVGGGHI